MGFQIVILNPMPEARHIFGGNDAFGVSAFL
jgi:hypothetical protein